MVWNAAAVALQGGSKSARRHLEGAAIPHDGGALLVASGSSVVVRLSPGVYLLPRANLNTGCRWSPEQQRRTRAIRLSALWKPYARLVRVRIFLFIPSVRPLLSRRGMYARMPSKCSLMVPASFLNGSRRDRFAQPIHSVSLTRARSGSVLSRTAQSVS